MMAFPTRSRFVIIGAGIHGLSTAYHLELELKARGRGSGADILVIDKSGIAAGAGATRGLAAYGRSPGYDSLLRQAIMSTKDAGIESEREQLIGQHIGYRYDVNLLPDMNLLTPFLIKYMKVMGWSDINWLEDVHMGYVDGKAAVFDRNINGWVTVPPHLDLPDDQQQ